MGTISHDIDDFVNQLREPDVSSVILKRHGKVRPKDNYRSQILNGISMIEQASKIQEVGRVQISRAFSFALGLPAFIVGTAVFMLGFSLARPGILAAAATLHGVAMAALVWWLLSRRIRVEALWRAILVLMLAGAIAVMWRMALIWTALRILG